MSSKTSNHNTEVHSHTVKMSFLLVLTLVRVNNYGGPFTTEQVKDVKTFLRLIPMAIVGGVLVGELFMTNYL